MTFYLTALTKDVARLVVHTLCTTDAVAADFVADHWEEQGYLVVRRQED